MPRGKNNSEVFLFMDGLTRKNRKRIISSFIILLTLLFVSAVRTALISSSPALSSEVKENSYLLSIAKVRKNIFDCNGEKLTGETEVTYACMSPTSAAYLFAENNFSGEEKKRILDTLNSGKPAYGITEAETETDGVVFVKVPVRLTESTLAKHLIGYTDMSGGVSGLEKAYEEELKTDAYVSVRYASYPDGKILVGISGETADLSSFYNSGVVTTVDKKIQSALEKAASGIKKGAAVISEIGSGKIRGIVSKPEFSVENMEESLSSSDSPFTFRALCGYNVGSAFKLCVAASAIENGKGKFTFQCTGSTVIDGHRFYCHNKAGHGTVNLGSAVSHSCNTYFYNLGVALSGRTVRSKATVFGFGTPIKLCKNISTCSENLPAEEDMDTLGETANLSIGQGKLLASPVKMLNLYSAIASGGVYVTPTLTEGITENGVMTEFSESGKRVKAMDEKTAATLRKYLETAIKDGTGTAAKPFRTTAAGKTATAQTGIKNENGDIENSWFCGYFPADRPKYCVAVLIEDSENSEIHGAEVFSKIADEVTLFELK